jgi:hypothetical protein
MLKCAGMCDTSWVDVTLMMMFLINVFTSIFQDFTCSPIMGNYLLKKKATAVAFQLIIGNGDTIVNTY